MCILCKNNGYILLPIDTRFLEGFLAKTDFLSKICPLCDGRKIDVFSYPDSLQADEYLKDWVAR